MYRRYIGIRECGGSIRKAGLHFPNAAIEDVEYHADRKLDQAQILQLSGCNYIAEKHNIIDSELTLCNIQFPEYSCAQGICTVLGGMYTGHIRSPPSVPKPLSRISA